MKYESIADIYSANEKIRESFTALAATITPDEAVALPDGEKWSVGQIVEHVAIVNEGISRIAAKLVAGAIETGKPSGGPFSLSATFAEKFSQVGTLKVEAPERVHPTGNVSIPDAVARLDANRSAYDAIRSDLEQYDPNGLTFPHPFFGDLTAAEWIIVSGGHEARHAAQIGRILAKVRQ